jgi:hypothetical protein
MLLTGKIQTHAIGILTAWVFECFSVKFKTLSTDGNTNLTTYFAAYKSKLSTSLLSDIYIISVLYLFVYLLHLQN